MRGLRWDIRQVSRQIVVLCLALLSADAFFYALLVRPRLGEYRTLTTENAPRIREIERREGRAREREAYVAGLKQAEEDLARLRKEILQTRDRRMIEVDEELARLAENFGINLEQVQYQNDTLADEGLERFAMTLPLQGGYSNLRTFIQAVEESTKFLVIERVALAEGAEGGVLLTMNITLVTYFDLPGVETAPSAGQKGARKV